jgi:catechol 2,3-dioxygenase-like lactoylglutathione lyase family enzyme
LTSIEFTVGDIEQCIELFAGLVGLELVGRAPHPFLDAEVAQLQAGPVTINLLCPTDTGRGDPVLVPRVRMSQLTFAVPDRELDGLRLHLAGGGAPVRNPDAGLVVLDPGMIESLLGAEAAVVFCAEGPEAGTLGTPESPGGGEDQSG